MACLSQHVKLTRLPKRDVPSKPLRSLNSPLFLPKRDPCSACQPAGLCKGLHTCLSAHKFALKPQPQNCNTPTQPPTVTWKLCATKLVQQTRFQQNAAPLRVLDWMNGQPLAQAHRLTQTTDYISSEHQSCEPSQGVLHTVARPIHIQRRNEFESCTCFPFKL